jgi:DNA helicase-2/ATP-dependent DNA helicase PcrA
VAVEDNVIPHERNKADEKRIEEERRLLFVGITRAEEELHLSFAQQRSTRGRPTRRVASPFLMELPRDEMEVIGQQNLDAATHDEASQVEWEDDVPSFQVFDDDDPPDRLSEDEADTSSAAVGAPLMTAADLAGSKTTTPLRCSPSAFQQGMVVMHPQYGVGKIVSLAGSGQKRTANVQFASEPAPITFRLAYSPLRPAIRRS